MPCWAARPMWPADAPGEESTELTHPKQEWIKKNRLAWFFEQTVLYLQKIFFFFFNFQMLDKMVMAGAPWVSHCWGFRCWPWWWH